VREVPYPDDILFVERDIYEFLLPLEYAMAAQELGRLSEAAEFYERALSLAALPEPWRKLAADRLRSCAIDLTHWSPDAGKGTMG